MSTTPDEEDQDKTMQETMWAAQWEYAESTGITERHPESINPEGPGNSEEPEQKSTKKNTKKTAKKS